MAGFTTDYTVFYRWQWFSRARWQGTFRERKRHSSSAFVELIKERGSADKPALDCSCGLGLKTIVMKEAGLNVHGSDGCALAIEHARQLAAEEGHSDITFFRSTWADLPRTAEQRYVAVFNDALSWVYSEEEMAASLKGFHDVLLPGGILTYMGALPGSKTDGRRLLERDWDRMLSETGKYCPGFHCSDDRLSVTEALVIEKGDDYIDRHHLYLIDEEGDRRLEAMTMRHVYKWQWPKMEGFLRAAGFREFTTKEFIAANGRPFPLIVAARD